ncbi:MAG: dihydrolipoamide acetyltransferase [Gammaproteobacteria bacterium]|nr:dihydrolipoamide acetyltransferase [Gammaproteobacteria bacterium]
MARIDIHIPDLGDFENIPVIEVLVAVGDAVAVEDPLVTLESDKSTMDVPSTHAGTVVAVAVAVDDQVSQGHLLCTLEATEDGGAGSGRDTSAGQSEAAAFAEPPPPSQADEDGAPPPTQTEHIRIHAPAGSDGATVSELSAAVGLMVAAGEVLMVLQQAGQSLAITAPRNGCISEVLVRTGDAITAGKTVAIIDLASDNAPSTPPTPPPVAAPRRPSPTASLSNSDNPQTSHATPAIRRFARELGVELSQVRGTGRKDRVLKEDVKQFVKERLNQPPGNQSPGSQPAAAVGTGIAPIPEVDFAKFGPIEVRPLSRIQRISGPHLHRAWLNVPHVTHHDEADVTELEAFRQDIKASAEARGVRVTMLAFITKAMAVALREYPTFNASLSGDGQSLILKRYYHVGIAVDTPTGLVVPVLKNVDESGIYDLAAQMGEVSARARDGKLTPQDLRGGCISISSLGGIGGTAFTPLVNAPEVAILGVSKARMQPVWNGTEFKPRLMLPLDLSYDHRVIDGAAAARFVAYLTQLLGDVRRLLL